VTTQLDPGCGDAAYTSTKFELTVDGQSSHVYARTRTARFEVLDHWSNGESVTVSKGAFGTDGTAEVRVRRPDAYAGAEGPIESFVVYPRRVFHDRATLQGDEVVITMLPGDKCCVVVNGVRRERCYIRADELAEDPDIDDPDVDVYDESQVAALTGRTLVFPPGVWDLTGDTAAWGAKLFPVQDNATVYFMRGAWAIGSFDFRKSANTAVASGIRMYGPGNVSGEWITNEEVEELPTFEEQRQHALIFGYVPGVGGVDNEVRDITFWQNPFYCFATAEVNRIINVTVLSPWHAHSDALKVFWDTSNGYVWEITGCIAWCADDAISIPEWDGAGTASNNLLSTAGAAVIQLGYSQDFRTNLPHVFRDNDVITCHYYYNINGAEGGAVINLWTDNYRGTDLYRANILIDGLYIDGDTFNSLLLFIGNRLYPDFGDGFAARGGYGAATDITIRNVVTETTPENKAKFVVRDIDNAPTGIKLEKWTIAGVPVSARNVANYITVPAGVTNLTIDGVPV
jgi:hypothetical protein